MKHRCGDVGDFADAVERLVLDEGGFAFTLGEVDKPMQNELDKAEDEAAGDGPDGDGVEDAMGGHAPRPDLNRAGGIIPEYQEMPVLAGGEELPLKRVIHQRMTGEQEKNDLEGIQPSVRRK